MKKKQCYQFGHVSISLPFVITRINYVLVSLQDPHAYGYMPPVSVVWCDECFAS